MTPTQQSAQLAYDFQSPDEGPHFADYEELCDALVCAEMALDRIDQALQRLRPGDIGYVEVREIELRLQGLCRKAHWNRRDWK